MPADVSGIRSPPPGWNQRSTIYLLLALLYAGGLFWANFEHLRERNIVSAGMVSWLYEARFKLGISSRASASPDGEGKQFGERNMISSARGYFVLLWTAVGLGLDPILFTKGLAWVLLLVAVIYLFRLGHLLGGPGAALVACVLLLHAPYCRTVGISVAFAYPLLCAFAYYLAAGKHRLLLVVLFLSGLFYVPVTVSCAALYGAHFVRRDPDSGRLVIGWRDRRLWHVAAVLLLLAPMVLPWSLSQSGNSVVSLTSYEQALDTGAPVDSGSLPGVDEGLYSPWMRSFILTYWAGHFVQALGQPLMVTGWPAIPFLQADAWTTRLAGAVALMGLLALWIVAGSRRLHPPLIVGRLVVSSAALYLVAVVLFPLLYMPDRLVHSTLSLAAFIYLGTLVSRWSEPPAPPARRHWPLLVLVAYLLLFGTGIRGNMGPGDDFRPAARLLGHLAASARSTLVAGPLKLMDGVELLADRETFLFCQRVDNSLLLGGDASSTAQRRLSALYQAYYATEGSHVLDFLRQHRVDLLVVDRHDFQGRTAAMPRDLCLGYHEEQMIRPLLEGSGPYFLAAPPAGAVEYKDPNYLVISLEALERSLGKGPAHTSGGT